MGQEEKPSLNKVKTYLVEKRLGTFCLRCSFPDASWGCYLSLCVSLLERRLSSTFVVFFFLFKFLRLSKPPFLARDFSLFKISASPRVKIKFNLCQQNTTINSGETLIVELWAEPWNLFLVLSPLNFLRNFSEFLLSKLAQTQCKIFSVTLWLWLFKPAFVYLPKISASILYLVCGP